MHVSADERVRAVSAGRGFRSSELKKQPPLHEGAAVVRCVVPAIYIRGIRSRTRSSRALSLIHIYADGFGAGMELLEGLGKAALEVDVEAAEDE